jgi:hypothetical protein
VIGASPRPQRTVHGTARRRSRGSPHRPGGQGPGPATPAAIASRARKTSGSREASVAKRSFVARVSSSASSTNSVSRSGNTVTAREVHVDVGEDAGQIDRLPHERVTCAAARREHRGASTRDGTAGGAGRRYWRLDRRRRGQGGAGVAPVGPSLRAPRPRGIWSPTAAPLWDGRCWPRCSTDTRVMSATS